MEKGIWHPINLYGGPEKNERCIFFYPSAPPVGGPRSLPTLIKSELLHFRKASHFMIVGEPDE